jgi:hypothetical protein
MSLRTILTTMAPILNLVPDKSYPSGWRAKASGTMIEVVTVSLVFLSAVIFVAHAFAAFRRR